MLATKLVQRALGWPIIAVSASPTQRIVVSAPAASRRYASDVSVVDQQKNLSRKSLPQALKLHDVEMQRLIKKGKKLISVAKEEDSNDRERLAAISNAQQTLAVYKDMLTRAEKEGARDAVIESYSEIVETTKKDVVSACHPRFTIGWRGVL